MNALIVNCSPVRDGATAEIARVIAERLKSAANVITVCIDDYDIRFCRGCRKCHDTGKCALSDDVWRLMAEMDRAERIVLVSPSYWGEIPGQFKAFIDRCTPWSNTHEPHASLSSGKIGYAVALRTGSGTRETEKILNSIEHFFGHLEIAPGGRLGLCGVEGRKDVTERKEEIERFAERILSVKTDSEAERQRTQADNRVK